jgi:multicomponent K+:H+ antiporter subunit D
MFAILTKVGVYVVIRLSLLLFSGEAGSSAGFGSAWLAAGGLVTIGFGTVGILASRPMSRIAGFCVIVSAGVILAAVGIGGEAALAGALYYLIASTLAASAFFLLIELLNRARGTTAPAVSPPVFSDEFRDPYEDGTETDEIGVIIPAAVGLVSGGFILCALLLAGLPPLSGFIGKLAIMTGLLPVTGDIPAISWVMIALLTLSSLATLVVLARVGIEVLWVPAERPLLKVQAVEFGAIAGLLAAAIALSAEGGLAMRYVGSTAVWLHAPGDYVRAVLGPEPPLPQGTVR